MSDLKGGMKPRGLVYFTPIPWKKLKISIHVIFQNILISLTFIKLQWFQILPCDNT